MLQLSRRQVEIQGDYKERDTKRTSTPKTSEKSNLMWKELL